MTVTAPLPITRGGLPGRRWRDDPLVRAVAALDPDPWRLALAVLAGTAALGCAIGLMAVSGWLITRAAQHPPVLYLEMAVVATRAFGIGRGVLRYAERLAGHEVALRGVVALRERIYRSLAAAPPAVAAGYARGDLLARVGADVDTLSDLVVRSLLPIAVALTTVTLSAALIGVLLPMAGLVILVGLVGAGALAAGLTAWAARRAERDAVALRSEQSAQVLALFDGLEELTVGGAVPRRLALLAGLEQRLDQALDRAARPASAGAGLSVLATGAAMVGALALATAAHADGRLDSLLVAVIALTPLAAAEAVTGLPAAATGLVRSRAAAERVLELLAVPAGPPPPTAPDLSPPAPPLSQRAPDQVADAGAPGPSVRLTARGLGCGWPGAAPALTGFDLDLRPGRRVAVVGESGCGKTTLLLTLAGLLPARAGSLTVSLDAGAALPLDQVDPDRLRRLVSFTAEDAHVFTTTLRENLRVADPGADDAALVAALDRAGLSGWLAGLGDGLDTMLGAAGPASATAGSTGISGGARRRLLLARAYLVGAAVLLLDEPGEHLDPDTADALVTDLLGTGDGPAVVLVTHRVAPLAAADEVIVLDAGRVAARGTHAWLVAHHPSYRQAVETSG